jgi:hypothetical protein
MKVQLQLISFFLYPVEDETDVDNQDLAGCNFNQEHCNLLYEVSVMLLYCDIVVLLYCHIVALLYCYIVMLSYCSVVLMMFLLLFVMLLSANDYVYFAKHQRTRTST